MQYALWEASQGEFERARSIFERALDVEPTAVSLWLKYTETVSFHDECSWAKSLIRFEGT